ncbi:hypothetical protein DFH09DRAFT_1366049 [Mycena vulgaris]|nr:hypothetical protein DFH09DRAFT_1366049 [Mycena vulgaris]
MYRRVLVLVRASFSFSSARRHSRNEALYKKKKADPTSASRRRKPTHPTPPMPASAPPRPKPRRRNPSDDDDDDAQTYEEALALALAPPSSSTDKKSKPKSKNTTSGTSGAGADGTFPVRVSALRRGHAVVIKGRPTRIFDLSSSRAGYGVKAHIIALDIFTGKKLEDIISTTARTQAPMLTTREYTLINIDAPTGMLSLLPLAPDDDTTPFDTAPNDAIDLPRFPAGLAARLQTAFARGGELRVTTVAAMGEEQVVEFAEVDGEGEGEGE